MFRFRFSTILFNKSIESHPRRVSKRARDAEGAACCEQPTFLYWRTATEKGVPLYQSVPLSQLVFPYQWLQMASTLKFTRKFNFTIHSKWSEKLNKLYTEMQNEKKNLELGFEDFENKPIFRYRREGANIVGLEHGNGTDFCLHFRIIIKGEIVVCIDRLKSIGTVFPSKQALPLSLKFVITSDLHVNQRRFQGFCAHFYGSFLFSTLLFDYFALITNALCMSRLAIHFTRFIECIDSSHCVM